MTPRELAKWRAERRRNERAGREAGPKSDIIKLLEERGVRFFRMNSGNIHIRKGHHLNLNRPGTPDILCLLKTELIQMRLNEPKGCGTGFTFSQPVWIEVKKSDGVSSKEQLEFQQQAEALGESYLICRSAEELGKWLDSNL